jgi:hypothetical protein
MEDYRHSPLVKKRTVLAIQYQMKALGLPDPLTSPAVYPSFNRAAKVESFDENKIILITMVLF